MAASRSSRWASRREWLATGVPGAAALLAVLLLQFTGFAPLERAGQLLFDAYQRSAPRAYEDAPVRIVDIDEESIRRHGQWPWPRTEVARLITRLADGGAAVIALDIVFSEPDRTSPARIAEQLRKDDPGASGLSALNNLPDNDATLAQAMAGRPVVTGFFLTNDPRREQAVPKAGFAISGSPPGSAVPEYRNAVESLPAFTAAAAGNGSLTLSGDADSIIRSTPLIARQGEQLLPALSLEALRVAQQAGAIVLKTSDGSGSLGGGRAESEVTALKVGQFEVPTSAEGRLAIYYTKPRPDRVVPAWQVLDGGLSPEDMQARFGGRIVFIGTGAIGLRDLISTPLSNHEPGVLVHAQAAEQMILGRFLVRPDWAPGMERALVIALGVALLLALPRLGAAKGAALGMTLAAATLGGSWLAFRREQFLLDPTFPMLAVLTVYLTITALTYYREERRRSYIHAAFDRYLAPEMVRRIAADPGQLELGGEEREMTVLFCDVRSFSHISEGLAPQEIIRFLIGFLTPMCDVLLERRATIDKFIGDAILAFWNAPLDDPDQYENAARAALAMIDRLHALNREMPGRADQPWPGEVRIGIGLNAGPCCVGNMGSAQRLSYSLIGDTVNLASRIEGLTKFYGVPIAIGDTLAEKLPHFATLPLDLVRVVGRDRPETIHALLGDEHMVHDPDFRALAEAHQRMLTAYRARAWEEAAELTKYLGKAGHQFGLDPLYAIYRNRVAQLVINPPPQDWDMVFTAAEK